MKKAILFIFIAVIIFSLIILKSLSCFCVNADEVIPDNISVTQNDVSFDVFQTSGFYELSDYSYHIQNNRLFISFYGSYFINSKNRGVSYVHITTEGEITQIICESKQRSVIWWTK